MDLTVGLIVSGKVTGMTNYGAFVSLPEGKSGMVHISEISKEYVTDIKNYLSVGQDVRVKIISVDENGRINLSIRKAEETYNQSVFGKNESKSLSFEDKLKQFLQESESKISDIKKHKADKNGGRRGQS